VLQRHQQFHEGREKTPVFWREALPAYFEYEGVVIIEAKDSTAVVTQGISFSVDE
jgi:N-methylhydantoinase A/oxoprolinase/acetone carboxylase beta subunit